MDGSKVDSGRFLLAVLGGWLACVVLVGNFASAQQSASPAPADAKSAQTPSTGVPSATVTEMKYEAGKLSLKANKADLVVLLKKISQASGVPIEVGLGISATISVEFVVLDLEEGINRILSAAGEKNLATEYTKKLGQKKDEYKIDKIVVMRKGGPSPASPSLDEKETQAALKSLARRDQEYRELFEKMDTEGNKIARTLKEYRDPKTSNDNRLELRTYLRQTPIRDPKDKKLLMEASIDPTYKEIQSELHMALLHAIQDKPEEADKEYILHLLENNANLGWLLYGMLNAWDERYVPYLLRDAKDGDIFVIEILGRAEVKEAVPLLEDLLKNSKNYTVRDAAWVALSHITGKEYKLEEVPIGAKNGEGKR